MKPSKTAGSAVFFFIQLHTKMEVIAAGGYGIIVSDSKTVTKLHHKGSSCKDGQKEYFMSRRVHNALKGVHCVTTPQPLGYSMQSLEFDGQTFMCSFSMQRIRGIKIGRREMLVHATLSRPGYDQELGQNQNMPVGPGNPTRGWHAGEDRLQARAGVAPGKVAQRMGAAIVHMVIDAHIYPFDVEYLVGEKQSLVVLDFGLAEPIPKEDFKDMGALVQKLFEDGNSAQTAMGIAYDIYYPSPDSKYVGDFLRGMEAAAKNSSMPAKAQKLVAYVRDDLG